MNDDQKKLYLAKCDHVASSLYSLDHHFAPWEDATEQTRLRYRQKAHLARVWWNGVINNPYWDKAQSVPDTDDVAPT